MLYAEKSTPLYLQLKDVLKSEILSGRLAPHARVPSERELGETYKVSRITVRQALAELTKEGFIYRVQGKGTFVSPPKVEQQLFTVTPFEETLKTKGLKPSTRLLDWRVESADFEIATKLAIPVASAVISLSLLGLGDAEPMVVFNSYFAEDLGRAMVKHAELRLESGKPFTTIDLYDDIKQPVPKLLTQSFEARAADRSTAETLKIPPGTPLLFVTSIIYDTNGKPVELKTAAYRGDKYRFHITRKLK